MNITLNLESPWEEVKEKLKENNIDLTDEDLVYDPANPDKLLNHLSKKLNRTPDQVKALVESISSNKARAS